MVSWWAERSLANQRHHVLEAVRVYQRAKVAHATAWLAHQAAETALAATGVTLTSNRLGYNADHRLVLPTEAPLSAARCQVTRGWQGVCTALEECPAVLAEVFTMLGAAP